MSDLPVELLELYCRRFSQVPMLTIDREGRIIYANPALLKKLALETLPKGEPVKNFLDIDISISEPFYRDEDRGILADLVTAGYTMQGERNTLRGHMLSDGTQSMIIFDIYREHDVEILEQVTRLNLEMSSITRSYSKQAQASRKMANQDALTSLSNRRHAEMLITDLIAGKPDPVIKPFGVILFDIDNFKSVNDTFGHDAGDQVLKMLSTTVRKQLRQQDIPARYGGEEFLIIVHCRTTQNLITIAEKLRSSFEELHIPLIDKAVTASFGVTMRRPEDTLATLTKRVDEALYLAKRSGKNCVISAD